MTYTIVTDRNDSGWRYSVSDESGKVHARGEALDSSFAATALANDDVRRLIVRDMFDSAIARTSVCSRIDIAERAFRDVGDALRSVTQAIAA